VTTDIEIRGVELVRDLEDRVTIDEQAAEDVPLRGLVERDLPISARLDGHEDLEHTFSVKERARTPSF